MVNGAIYTLTSELYMYAILSLVWAALRISPKFRLISFKIIIITSAIVTGLYLLARHFFFPEILNNAQFYFMFFVGASFYILRKHIVLSSWPFWLCVISLSLAAAVNKHVFFVVYVFAIAYVLIYIAYVPSGFIRKYNQLGDYSYGIYF